MITIQQRQSVVNFLKGKNLPLDLLVEVEDHMGEQIEDTIQSQNMNFGDAFKLVQKAWSTELKMKRDIFSFGKYKTKFQREIQKETNRKMHYQALKYFVPFILIAMLFLFINIEISKYVILFANVFVGLTCLLITIKDYRLIKTGNYSYSRQNISILQKKMSFVMVGCQTLFFIVPFYSAKFEKFINSINQLPELNFVNFLSIVFPFIYVYLGIVGVLYYLEYKKTIEILEQKTGLKL